ncbi:shootin-1-like [Sphaerodactylus townsendi]|uniref:shootin-1-like n=1 Tax=Sphaerodactylus townsendi TaxID=933632 RepID=UPI002025D0C1|nr:shootin-1-like [Sphaerodactylus townsendi]
MELSQDGVRQLEAILESGSDLSEEDGDEKAVLQERDEAKEKLEEFEQASRALLVELNSLEAEYEIEKSCRVQAEAYAMQMNRENTKLKRISAALLPMLSHPTVDFVSLDNEDENAGELTPDPVGQYLQQIKDLQTKVSHLLYEKKDLNLQVKELQGRVQCLQEQVEEEASEKKSLQGFVKHHQQALRRVKQGTLTALGCGGDTGSGW